MFCTNCGVLLEGEFCWKCGTASPRWDAGIRSESAENASLTLADYAVIVIAVVVALLGFVFARVALLVAFVVVGALLVGAYRCESRRGSARSSQN